MKPISVVYAKGAKVPASQIPYAKSKARHQERLGIASQTYALPGNGFAKVVIDDAIIKITISSVGGTPPNYYFAGGTFDSSSYIYPKKAFPDENPEDYDSYSFSVTKESEEEAASFVDDNGFKYKKNSAEEILFYEDEQYDGFCLDSTPRLKGKLARFIWKKGKTAVLGGAGRRHSQPTYTIQNTNQHWGYPEHPHSGIIELKPTIIDSQTLEVKYEGAEGSECVSAIIKHEHVISINGDNKIVYWKKENPEVLYTHSVEIPESYNRLDWIKTQWFFNKSGDAIIGCVYSDFITEFEFGDRFYRKEAISIKPTMCIILLSYKKEGEQLSITSKVFTSLVSDVGLIGVDWYEGPVPDGGKEEDSEEDTYSKLGNPFSLFDGTDVISYAYSGLSQFRSNIPTKILLDSTSRGALDQIGIPFDTTWFPKVLFPASPEDLAVFHRNNRFYYRTNTNDLSYAPPSSSLEDDLFLIRNTGGTSDSRSRRFAADVRRFPNYFDTSNYQEYLESPLVYNLSVTFYTSLSSSSYYNAPIYSLSYTPADAAPYNLGFYDTEPVVRDYAYTSVFRTPRTIPIDVSLDLRTHSIAAALSLNTDERIIDADTGDINKFHNSIFEYVSTSFNTGELDEFTIYEYAASNPTGNKGYSYYNILPDHPDDVYSKDEKKLKSLNVFNGKFSFNTDLYENDGKEFIEELFRNSSNTTDYRPFTFLDETRYFVSSSNGNGILTSVAAKVYNSKLYYSAYCVVPHGDLNYDFKVEKPYPGMGADSHRDHRSWNVYTKVDVYCGLYSPLSFAPGILHMPMRGVQYASHWALYRADEKAFGSIDTISHDQDSFFETLDTISGKNLNTVHENVIISYGDNFLFKNVLSTLDTGRRVIAGEQYTPALSEAETPVPGVGSESSFNKKRFWEYVRDDQNNTFYHTSDIPEAMKTYKNYWVGPYCIMTHIRIPAEASVFL